MSRKVDVSDLESLDESELIYLRDRGLLTAEQEEEWFGPYVEPEKPTLDDVPYTGDENTAPSVLTENGEPTMDPDDYEDASNERLREELRRRGLGTSGNKAELIERLEEDDLQREEGEEAE